MTQIILIFIGIAIIAILLMKKTREKILRPAQDKIVGICSSALDQTVRKNTNKEKALEFIRTQSGASNEDIREHLGVSQRSVVCYLDELEKEGKIEQVGDIGRGVVYRSK